MSTVKLFENKRVCAIWSEAEEACQSAKEWEHIVPILIAMTAANYKLNHENEMCLN